MLKLKEMVSYVVMMLSFLLGGYVVLTGIFIIRVEPVHSLLLVGGGVLIGFGILILIGHDGHGTED